MNEIRRKDGSRLFYIVLIGLAQLFLVLQLEFDEANISQP